MKAEQVSVKLYAERDDDFDLGSAIPIFHRWIQADTLEGQRPIDVADYRHVERGPGVLLIGYEGHYGIDRADGELGLSFSRKRDEPGDARGRVAEALRLAARACRLFEGEAEGKLRFSPTKVKITLLSRLTAPNDGATFERFAPIAGALLGGVTGGAATFERESDPKRPFSVVANIAGAHDLEALISELEAIA